MAATEPAGRVVVSGATAQVDDDDEFSEGVGWSRGGRGGARRRSAEEGHLRRTRGQQRRAPWGSAVALWWRVPAMTTGAEESRPRRGEAWSKAHGAAAA